MQIVLDVSEWQSVAQLDTLLTKADDEIVGVWIKATEGVSYRDSLADAFTACCDDHKTPFGFYDFMSNDQADAQRAYFQNFVADQALAELIPMLDCEPPYSKGEAGVQHWQAGYRARVIVYASLDNMPQYAGLALPKWVAQYDQPEYYRPQEAAIASYKTQGYTLWQWTDNYMGFGQDASVLLGDYATLRAA